MPDTTRTGLWTPRLGAANGNGRTGPHRSALTAAAEPIDPENRTQARLLRTRRQQWQADAFDYYDAIGEVKFAVNYRANAVSKLRLFAGVRPEPDADPVPVDDPDADVPGPVAAQAAGMLERLHPNDGEVSDLLREHAVNFDVAGEAYLVGTPAEGEREESWDIHSIDELKIDGTGRMRLAEAPGERGAELADDTTVLRMWLRHPRWSALPDSPMNGVLDICEELVILTRAVRAAATSRIAGAGLLLVPEELSFGGSDPTRDPSAGDDSFMDDLVEAMTTPIRDEGHASAVVPPALRGKAEHLKEVRHLLFDRPIDATIDKRTETAIRRLSQGLDLPPEILTGMADLNHWNAWMVSEQTFAAHVQPLVHRMLAAYTIGWFRPQLVEAGMDRATAKRLVIWYDASAVTSPAPSSEDADAALDRRAISLVAYRRVKGFGEDDAPEAGEPPGPGPGPGGEGDMPVEGPPAMDRPAGDEMPPAMMAAALDTTEPDRAAARLTTRLAQIDARLRARLEAACDLALRRALEKAGAKVRNRAKGDTRKAVSQVANPQVVATLGPALFATLGLSDDDVLADAFAELGNRFDVWVAQAQGAAADALTQAGVLDEAGREALAHRQAEDRRDGWLLLAASLLGLAKLRLYDPSPAAPAEGEFDPDLAVPPGVLRAALARAGGETAVPLDGVGVPVGGVATGPAVLGPAGAAGFAVGGYRWVHDAPARPFEPHVALDGVEFVRFDDALLANHGTFPSDTPFLFPGDHAGCRCVAEPILIGGSVITR